MNFYKTTNYLKSEIAKKEAEIKQLKKEIFDAQVREFYWHINERVRVMDEDFYDTQWEISFGDKSVTLPNCAEVFQGIEQVLVDYMEEENIQHKEKNE